MSTVIAEAEETIVGQVQAVRNENGLYYVQTTGVDGQEFTIRHPEGDAENAIRALGHYLSGEAYRRKKVEKDLNELKELASIALLGTERHSESQKADALEKLLKLISE